MTRPKIEQSKKTKKQQRMKQIMRGLIALSPVFAVLTPVGMCHVSCVKGHGVMYHDASRVTYSWVSKCAHERSLLHELLQHIIVLFHMQHAFDCNLVFFFC